MRVWAMGSPTHFFNDSSTTKKKRPKKQRSYVTNDVMSKPVNLILGHNIPKTEYAEYAEKPKHKKYYVDLGV